MEKIVIDLRQGIIKTANELKQLLQILEDTGTLPDMADTKDDYVDSKKAKALLGGISNSTLYRLRIAGKIKANKVNTKVIYYSTNSIRNYLNGANNNNILE